MCGMQDDVVRAKGVYEFQEIEASYRRDLGRRCRAAPSFGLDLCQMIQLACNYNGENRDVADITSNPSWIEKNKAGKWLARFRHLMSAS